MNEDLAYNNTVECITGTISRIISTKVVISYYHILAILSLWIFLPDYVLF